MDQTSKATASKYHLHAEWFVLVDEFKSNMDLVFYEDLLQILITRPKYPKNYPINSFDKSYLCLNLK